jgi:hypothetical protein
MLNFVVSGDTMVTAESPPFAANVGVEGGCVAGLYVPHDTPPTREVVDASGKLVLAGTSPGLATSP